jgi:hypothetical protein
MNISNDHQNDEKRTAFDIRPRAGIIRNVDFDEISRGNAIARDQWEADLHRQSDVVSLDDWRSEPRQKRAESRHIRQAQRAVQPPPIMPIRPTWRDYVRAPFYAASEAWRVFWGRS